MTEWLKVTRHPIDLKLHRCFGCGRYWACEPIRNARCPLCAEAVIDRMAKELAKMERSNAALRGAVTRAKRAKR